MLQLTIGDKGAYLYGVFGAPVAHEDDAARACEAALRLLEIADEVPVTDVQVGVATGRLRSGTYGHPERRTFCCLGDAVNLAARLMTRAPAGGRLVHGDVAEADRRALRLGGAAARSRSRDARSRCAVRAAARPRGPAPTPGARRPSTPWSAATPSSPGSASCGRQPSRAGVRSWSCRPRPAPASRAWSTSWSASWSPQGVPVARGEATPIAAEATYAAWRDVWTDLLGLDHDTTRSAPTASPRRWRGLEPALLGRAPLLGPVLGLTMPDSDLTASFDGELRKTSLEDLLRRLLVARAAAGSLAVVVEDAHWLDPLSRDLLEALARATSGVGALLVLTSRPDGTALAGLPVGRGDHVTDLALEGLGREASAALVSERHRALTGRDPGPELVATVVGRAEGNAFYLEQLVDYVLAHASAEGAVDPDALELPPSLHSLVLSRIDAQPENPRRAVKVASVIGRAFRSPLVAAAYPDLGPEARVHDELVSLTPTRLIELEDPRDKAFAFGHAVTRDVAYDSLPFAVRSLLHGQVGDALESEPDGPEPPPRPAGLPLLPQRRRTQEAALPAGRRRRRPGGVRQRGGHLLPRAAPAARRRRRAQRRAPPARRVARGPRRLGGRRGGGRPGRARPPSRSPTPPASPAPARRRPSWPASRDGTSRPRASWPPRRPPSSTWATRPDERASSTCAARSPPSRGTPTRPGRRTKPAWPCARPSATRPASRRC